MPTILAGRRLNTMMATTISPRDVYVSLSVAENKSAAKGRLVKLSFSNIYFGSGGRDRTYDQLINSQLLYR